MIDASLIRVHRLCLDVLGLASMSKLIAAQRRLTLLQYKQSSTAIAVPPVLLPLLHQSNRPRAISSGSSSSPERTSTPAAVAPSFSLSPVHGGSAAARAARVEELLQRGQHVKKKLYKISERTATSPKASETASVSYHTRLAACQWYSFLMRSCSNAERPH
jgi:hypothetical protein